MLDYDNLEHDEVVKDCERLTKEYPALGPYMIEPSQSGKANHWHACFPKSAFSTFQEAYAIAEHARVDEDWLELCKIYECFALETDTSRQDNQARQQKQQVLNKPSRRLTSPVILDLKPLTTLDGRRIVKLCEAIDPKKDPTWQYTSFTLADTLEEHVQIGCVDEAQATRRMRWLSEQNLNFTASFTCLAT